MTLDNALEIAVTEAKNNQQYRLVSGEENSYRIYIRLSASGIFGLAIGTPYYRVDKKGNIRRMIFKGEKATE